MAMEDVSLDLEELRQLHSIAKRSHVLSLLSSEIRSLEDKKSLKEAADELTKPTPTPTLSNPVVNYVSLSSFCWEEDNEKVKMYISLEGVQQDKMEVDFKPRSFDIKLHDVRGKNYRCAIPNLFKEIVPEKCKVLVKPKRFMITLIKASNGLWRDLVNREDKLKPKLDNEKDPMSGIMDLMKNMYDKGDDDMKRTIAKAWSDARSGKTADPMKGI